MKLHLEKDVLQSSLHSLVGLKRGTTDGEYTSFMSQSIVSLLVAGIALVGVLVTTWWNNRSADRRRREDQEAEDMRRRREDARREQERQERLVREDFDRQRRAVADFIKKLREAESTADGATREKMFANLRRFKTNKSAREELDLERVSHREEFYVKCLTALQTLELEIQHPAVMVSIKKFFAVIGAEIQAFEAKRDENWDEYVVSVSDTAALSGDLQTCLNELIAQAKKYLHVPIGK